MDRPPRSDSTVNDHSSSFATVSELPSEVSILLKKNTTSFRFCRNRYVYCDSKPSPMLIKCCWLTDWDMKILWKKPLYPLKMMPRLPVARLSRATCDVTMLSTTFMIDPRWQPMALVVMRSSLSIYLGQWSGRMSSLWGQTSFCITSSIVHVWR